MVSELRQIQLKCLEILDFVLNVCQMHNIKYSLCGGSVVGAHLYKGFLPWDDDIDIMMTRENYNLFLKVANNYLPKHLTIMNYQNGNNTDISKENFTKIMNNQTTLVQPNGEVLGIFVDITVYDKVPKGWLKNIDLYLYKRAMTINRGEIPGNSLKNKVRNLMLFTILSDRERFLRFFQRTVEFLGNISKHYTYRELFGAFYYVNMIPYKPSIFENYRTIEFEGRSVMIVRDYIDYLKTRYNRTDFHEPTEKQVPTHYVYVNFDLPYKDYLENMEKRRTKPT